MAGGTPGKVGGAVLHGEGPGSRVARPWLGKKRDANGFERKVLASPLTGAVIYKESIRLIDGADVADELKRVYRRVKDLSVPLAPPKTPSASECRFCDIGSCPSRVATTEAAATKTRLF